MCKVILFISRVNLNAMLFDVITGKKIVAAKDLIESTGTQNN